MQWYNKKFPKEIVHALEMNGKLELGNMNVEQGIAHVLYVVQNICAQTAAADIIICLLETYQLIVKIEGIAITSYVYALWTQVLREFLHINNSKIEMP